MDGPLYRHTTQDLFRNFSVFSRLRMSLVLQVGWVKNKPSTDIKYVSQIFHIREDCRTQTISWRKRIWSNNYTACWILWMLFEFSVEASTKKEAAFKFEEMPYNAECPHDCYQNIYTISGMNSTNRDMQYIHMNNIFNSNCQHGSSWKRGLLSYK